MATLKCDICGGNIVVQAGGQMGECANCGAAYSLERMREIVTGVKVSQTGTAEDVEQWRALLSRYYNAGDFTEADRIVKKILEAVPDDEDAGKKYDELQILKYMEVKNGTLMSYTGGSADLVVPDIVTSIGSEAFKKCSVLRSIVLPGSVTSIGKMAFTDCYSLQQVTLSNGLTNIGNQAFSRCSSLKSITIPSSVRVIENWAFNECTALTRVDIQKGVTTIGMGVFQKCQCLQSITIPASVTFVGELAFKDCPSLNNMNVDDAALPAVLASGFTTDYELELCYSKDYLVPLRNTLRSQHRCDFCGSPLTRSGWTGWSCKNCNFKLHAPRRM